MSSAFTHQSSPIKLNSHVSGNFEAIEKRFQLVMATNTDEPSFLTWPESRWQTILDWCGASILSQMTTPDWRAFVLSESSLFVSEREVILLTCGDCPLIHSLRALLQQLNTKQIAFVSYLRQAELAPDAQHTSGTQDITMLQQCLAPQISDANEMATHSQQPPFYLRYQTQANIPTPHTRLQGHGLSGKALEACQQANDIKQLRNLLQLTKFFAGYQLDDWLFSPMGYSVNGLKGEHYFTLHLTPEEDVSYVSIEGSEPLLINRFGAFLQRLFQRELQPPDKQSATLEKAIEEPVY